MWPPSLNAWLQAQGYGPASVCRAVGGGSISQAWHVSLAQRRDLFIKLNSPSAFAATSETPSSAFSAEAEGLAYLNKVANLRVPEVITHGAEPEGNYLVMEYIASGPPSADFWPSMGRQLATMHLFTRDEFGFFNDNFCGHTLQNNSFNPDGIAFFIEQRILPLMRRNADAGHLTIEDCQQIEGLLTRLPTLVPMQPASLLHGDLWSGNVLSNAAGEPVFIDPAVYFGWAEVDLAMTQLFGGFPDAFYAAYEEVRPLAAGWRERLALYNLYPLLNHLWMFGASYLQSVRQIVRQYA